MIIDLTHTITPEMPMYPGSAAPSIWLANSFSAPVTAAPNSIVTD